MSVSIGSGRVHVICDAFRRAGRPLDGINRLVVSQHWLPVTHHALFFLAAVFFAVAVVFFAAVFLAVLLDAVFFFGS